MKQESNNLREIETTRIKSYAYILTHMAKLSQKNEKKEFTLEEYVAEFKTTPEIQSAKQLFVYMMELEKLGYIIISKETPKVTTTQKFLELCEQAKRFSN